MYIKTLFPSAVGLGDHILSDIIDDALNAGFYGYWFFPEKEFTLPKEELKALIQRKHIVAMGMELSLDFRKDEKTFISRLEKIEEYASYASFIGIRRASSRILPPQCSLTYREKQRLGKILGILEKYNIALGLEFQSSESPRKEEKQWPQYSPARAMTLLSAIEKPNVGLVINYRHWTLSGENLSTLNSIDGSMITALYISTEIEGLTEYEDMEQVNTTTMADISKFLKAIEDTHYSGPVIVESNCAKLKALNVKDKLDEVSHSIDRALMGMKRGI